MGNESFPELRDFDTRVNSGAEGSFQIMDASFNPDDAMYSKTETIYLANAMLNEDTLVKGFTIFGDDSDGALQYKQKNTEPNNEDQFAPPSKDQESYSSIEDFLIEKRLNQKYDIAPLYLPPSGSLNASMGAPTLKPTRMQIKIPISIQGMALSAGIALSGIDIRQRPRPSTEPVLDDINLNQDKLSEQTIIDRKDVPSGMQTGDTQPEKIEAPAVIDGVETEIKRLEDTKRTRAAHRHRIAKLHDPLVALVIGKARFSPKTRQQFVGRDKDRMRKMRQSVIADAQNDDGTERFRELTPTLQAMFADKKTRRDLMGAIDETIANKSDYLKEKMQAGEIPAYDYVFVGAGYHTAVAISTIRELDPEATILVIEKGQRIGGEFRRHGDRPAFTINSRNRRHNRNLKSIPRTPGNINPMGEYAPLQVFDVSEETYVQNTLLGDVIAANIYLGATDILIDSSFDSSIPLEDGFDETLGYENRRFKQFATQKYSDTIDDATILRIKDPRNVGITRLVGNEVFYALGTPNRRAFENYRYYRWYFDGNEFYDRMGNLNGNDHDALAHLRGKKVAVIGGGDTASTIIAYALGGMPAESYDPETPLSASDMDIHWFGVNFDNAEEAQECLRARYVTTVVPFMPKSRLNEAGKTPIKLHRAKVKRIGENRRLASLKYVEEAIIKTEDYDAVIDCSSAPTIQPVATASIVLDPDETDRIIARRVDLSTNQFLIGPTARIIPSKKEQKILDEIGISANTVAMWLTGPRTEKLARVRVARVRARRQFENTGTFINDIQDVESKNAVNVQKGDPIYHSRAVERVEKLTALRDLARYDTLSLDQKLISRLINLSDRYDDFTRRIFRAKLKPTMAETLFGKDAYKKAGQDFSTKFKPKNDRIKRSRF